MARQPSENTESRALVRWVRMEHADTLLIAHIPNETPTTPDIAARLKSMGVSAGFPDYIIVNWRTQQLAFVELKKRKGGRTSKEQLDWLAALGPRARVCKGWHEAAAFITDRLL